MRKNLFFTSVSLILIVFLLGFAIYSLLYPLGRIRSQVSFIFADTNLYLEIEATANWVEDNIENKRFYASTHEGRLNKEVWNAPNIIFSTQEENELRTAEITILIYNKNPERKVKVTITQVACDSEPAYLEDPRFISKVGFKDGKTGANSSHTIGNASDEIESDIPASPDSDDLNFMILTLEYELIRENIDFNFFQNLRIEFKSIPKY